MIDSTDDSEHPPFPSLYQPRGVPAGRLRGPARQISRIAPLRSMKRRGRPCRLVKSHERISMSGGHDIQPGQLCVAVETAGTGRGDCFDGIHAVRARLQSRRRLTVARVQHLPDGAVRLMWDSRSSVELVEDVEIVGNVVGCYSGDRELAPLVTMFSN